MNALLFSPPSRRSAVFWAQVVGAVWMTTYILHPSPLPTNVAPPMAWLFLLLIATMFVSCVAQPWFVGFFALFAVMAMHTTRSHTVHFHRLRIQSDRDDDDDDDAAAAIAEKMHTAQMSSMLAGIDGQAKMLEVALVDQFVPLGKSFLSGGKENIRVLPVMPLP